MTDTNMIERVARAIFSSDFHPSERDKETLDKYIADWPEDAASANTHAKAALAEIEAMGLVIVPSRMSNSMRAMMVNYFAEESIAISGKDATMAYAAALAGTWPQSSRGE